jgi:phosphosulfolactate phosphohydrolase-like enzyme
LNEIGNLSDIIKSNNDQVAIKRKRLEYAKSIDDFTLCDQLSGAIKALLVEKANYERQITALKRKEAGSKSYFQNKKVKQRPKFKKDISIIDMLYMQNSDAFSSNS